MLGSDITSMAVIIYDRKILTIVIEKLEINKWKTQLLRL